MKGTKLPLDSIIKDYEKGLSTYDLGKKHSVRPETINRWLIKKGVKMRDRVSAAALKNRNRGINHNYFENIITQNPSYFAGFIAADGCIYRSKKMKGQARLNVHLHEQDLHILESLKKELDLTQKIESLKSNTYRICKSNKLTICSDKIAESLAVYGITERKTFTITFPHLLKKEILRHYIRGLFDGDGCVSANGKTGIKITIVSGNKLFIEQLQNHLLQNHSIITPEIRSYPTYHILSIMRQSAVLKFYKLIYNEAELFLIRKKSKFEALIEEKYKNIIT